MKRRGFLATLAGMIGVAALAPRAGSAPVPAAAESTAALPVIPEQRQINITIEGDGQFTAQQIRDRLVPALNDALANGSWVGRV